MTQLMNGMGKPEKADYESDESGKSDEDVIPSPALKKFNNATNFDQVRKSGVEQKFSDSVKMDQ